MGMLFPAQASLISWISLRAIRSLWSVVQRQGELKASRRVKGKYGFGFSFVSLLMANHQSGEGTLQGRPLAWATAAQGSETLILWGGSLAIAMFEGGNWYLDHLR